ncbi:MAG: hypothetical protein EOP45_13010 [Sphingobacteriaceae bacterium]|nr:MAG: hypothetical protein EOP45_13010 [Sphingobacteriaceae bacterium]
MHPSHYFSLFTTLPSVFRNSFLVWIILICFFSENTFAKTATVHLVIKNYKGSVSIYDPQLRYELAKKRFVEISPDAQGAASYTMNTDQPTYLLLRSLSNNAFNWCLFLSPGDELFLTADFTSKDHRVTITGKGSNNNQPEIFALTNLDTEPFRSDKTPGRVIAAINKQYLLNKNMLTSYIKVNKPSDAFIKNAMLNLKYFAPANFYEFSHNSLFRPKEELKPWLRIQDSLFATVKLSNDEAVNAYNYNKLVDNFVLREAEAGKLMYESNPAEFYQHWFPNDPAKGKIEYNGTQTSVLNDMVIGKYFSGKAAEYAYGQTIKFKFVRADYPTVIEMYSKFKKEFPANVYLAGFDPTVAGLVNKQQQTFSKETIFVRDNGTKLNTFKDVLALTKGKAALIDMWGTWCSPCRTEIEKNALKLEAHFKGKKVNFIYIANDDIGREQLWKKAIAYFQIEGIHILANPTLTKDIMDKAKYSGYPSY